MHISCNIFVSIFIWNIAYTLAGIAPHIRSNIIKKLVAKDALKTTPELLTEYGYPREIHHKTTEDGYILELHRIPGRTDKPPVIVQHGILGSSADWVYTGPGKSLVLMLSDAGYDVWLGNSRGNQYSTAHVNLSTKDPRFWDFTWHEMGVYDLSATIDHVLHETNASRVVYIGHSQGTTISYVLTSTRPEYNSKLMLVISLAPIAFISNMKSHVIRLLANENFIPNIIKAFGHYKLEVNNELMAIIGNILCNKHAVTKYLCEDLLALMVGFDKTNVNYTLFPTIFGHYPSGISLKQLLHYQQSIRSGGFRQYDYGTANNWSKYGRATPPSYDLSHINSSVLLFYSVNDWISSELDVKLLYEQLPTARMILNPDHKFNHMDYLWGINANQVLYPVILKEMSSFNNIS